MDSFWAACEARGPLILEVEDGDGRPSIRYAFDRPNLIIGSGPRADLRLDSPDVSRRHAYLQIIAGQPFCVDLDSRTGTFVDDESRSGGWLKPGRSIRIGRYRIRVGWGGDDEKSSWDIGWNPLSVRDSRAMLPGPTMTLIVADESGFNQVPIRRVLTLIGRSPRCKIRFSLPDTSRFHGALLRLPSSVWAIDLLASDGITINGIRSNSSRLEAGDKLTVGPLVARITPPELNAGSCRLPTTVTGKAVDCSAPTDRNILQPILQQVAGIQPQSNEQFGQVILQITQLFGTMHREMVDLVREELDQIRRLADEMQTLRADIAEGLQNPTEQVQAVPASNTSPQTGRATSTDGHGPDEPMKSRDLGEVHLLVSERLVAFEMERQSRWKRITKMLLKTNL